MAGVDLRTLQDLGGWRSLGMVARYAHLSPGHRHTAIERLVTRDREGTSIPAAANGVAP
jgi:site-specific recombinase XerD